MTEASAPPGWVLIENDAALFRGPGRGSPMEVWNPGAGWTSYAGGPKGVQWGGISSVDAEALMEWRVTSLDRLRKP